MFGRGFRIATIRGVPVNVDSSWIWIAVLLVATFWAQLDRDFPNLASAETVGYALFGALVFFGSVFLHEAAHAVAARANGIEVHGITLVFFGGFTAARADEKGPGPAFSIAALGPPDGDLDRSAPRAVQLRERGQPVHGCLQCAARAAARRRPHAAIGRVARDR
jgi:hypothetical protein